MLTRGLLLLMLSFFLTACGGGGGGSTPAADNSELPAADDGSAADDPAPVEPAAEDPAADPGTEDTNPDDAGTGDPSTGGDNTAPEQGAPAGSGDDSGDNSGDNSGDGSGENGGNEPAASPEPPVQPPPSLSLNFSEPPFDLQGAQASFAADVAYGPHSRNVFDIFMPASNAPTAIAIYLHSGGFQSGDKSQLYQGGYFQDVIRGGLQQNIAFATINYRLLEHGDDEGVIKSLNDAQRALQFIRYQHQALNIDKPRVALFGNSAGAGTSLWLAFSDDRADPDNTDPVLRESTRVRTAAALETQGSYDLVRWESDIFLPHGLSLEDIIAIDPYLESLLLDFNGIDHISEMYTPEGVAYREQLDMLDMLSADDPEFFIENSAITNGGAPVNSQELLHHSLHGQVLFDRANQLGVSAVVYLPVLGVEDSSGEELHDFLLRKLNE